MHPLNLVYIFSYQIHIMLSSLHAFMSSASKKYNIYNSIPHNDDILHPFLNKSLLYLMLPLFTIVYV